MIGLESSEEAVVPIRDAAGRRIGNLTIKALSRYLGQGTLKVEPEAEGGAKALLLLEDCEYWFGISVDAPGPFRSDRDDLFIWDPDDKHGHLRPGSHVGLLPITIFAGANEVGAAELEVRSRKLNYEADYQWMLRDVAETSAELILQRFAVTKRAFAPSIPSGFPSAYGQFEFLKSIVSRDALGAALEQVQNRPHHSWELEPELNPATQGAAGGRIRLPDLLRPGPRVPWPAGPSRLRTLPAILRVDRPHATYDTLPNRFVKFALQRWRAEVATLQSICGQGAQGPPRDRAMRETGSVIDWLDAALAWPVFDEVRALERFPADNTVLMAREGYREFFAAFAIFELVAGLDWSGGESVYHAGQRNVATLYEYWCFLQLGRLIAKLSGNASASLVVMDKTGTKLDLRRGRESVMDASVLRLGRQINLRLFFNRSFGGGSGSGQSWSRAMRPDCSLQLISPEDSDHDSVWVHFDAKYRIDRLDQIFSDADDVDDSDEPMSVAAGRAKRDDLLKMHAYRDAIRRSAGSFVIYPGPNDAGANTEYRQFHEVLPGIGAFALRPSVDGDASGMQALARFVEDLLTHHASLLTQQRRGRYWESISFSPRTVPKSTSGWQPTRLHPAADTPALIGYVRSSRHMQWVLDQLRYNLRLGRRRGAIGVRGAESRVEVLVLNGPTLDAPRVFIIEPPPEIWSREDLSSTGYDSPRGEIYLCLVIHREVSVPIDPREFRSSVRRLASTDGSPRVVSWSELFGVLPMEHA